HRGVRVALYLGYTLLSSATLVYLKSVRFTDTGQIVPLGSESTMLEQFGAVGLGLPLIAYTFIQGLGRRRPIGAADGASQPPARLERPEQQGAGSPGSRRWRRSLWRALTARTVTTLLVPFSAAMLLLILVTLASCVSFASAGTGTSTGSHPFARDTF